MRKALSDLLAQAALKDPRIIVMSGDHGYAIFDGIREKCPTQFMNCGVAEQNMVGVAAGLAKAGFRPIVYGLAAFVPIRVLEQIKIDVCLEELPVIFLGDGAGFVYSTLGSSHQCFEDIAALRPMANIEIFSPADRFELSKCFSAALEKDKPSYLRLGKADLGDVHQDGIRACHTDFVFPVIADGNENLCLATGSMVKLIERAVKNADLAYDLYSVARLKKMDSDRLLRLCTGRKRVIVAEEHSIYGGLGSIVAEAIAGKFSVEFDRIGIQDKFSGECGTYEHLLRYHGLDEMSVLKVLRDDT
jgi:transketolase